MNLQPKQGTYIPHRLTATPFEDFIADGKNRILNNREFCGFTMSDVAIHFSEQQDGGLLDGLVKFLLTANMDVNALPRLSAYQAFANDTLDRFFKANENHFWSHFEQHMQYEQDEYEIRCAGY